MIRIPILNREARFEGPQQAGSFGASYVIGVAFAFGWTPCIGPILGAILSLAAQEETISAGTAPAPRREPTRSRQRQGMGPLTAQT